MRVPGGGQGQESPSARASERLSQALARPTAGPCHGMHGSCGRRGGYNVRAHPARYRGWRAGGGERAVAGADGTSSASEAAPDAGSGSYGASCHGSTLAYATCKVGTTVTRAVRLTGPPGCVDCEARGRGRASRSASGGPAPCEAGPGPSPVSGEGSGSGGRARTPAHAELFSSRQAALSPRGDSKCLISGWGGAGRRLTAGIAWRGHRPGRHGGIGRGALGGVHSHGRSSAMLFGQGTSCERGRVRGSDQLQQVACGSVPNCTAVDKRPRRRGGQRLGSEARLLGGLGLAVCFLLASEPTALSETIGVAVSGFRCGK